MQYQIDPRTAPAVLEMFTMYDKGTTMKEIVAYMSERGVTTVRGKKIDLNFMVQLPPYRHTRWDSRHCPARPV